MRDTTFGLSGVTLVTPDEIRPNTPLAVSQGRIARLGHPGSGPVLDLRDHLVFPGLINAHDHLYGAWWPRIAPTRPYANVYQWLAEYDQSPTLRERGRNSVQDMYEFGMYRNLISGVTTVADSYKRIDGPEFYTRHPIHVLHEYGRTWTVRERTSWGDDIPTEYRRAVQAGQPYITHLAEGVDQETASEMDVLTEAKALGRNTMVVHGVSLRRRDMQSMAAVGASLCWCPASNSYLYGQTANILALQEAGVNLTLGTDSSLTGGLNLLDEVRTARRAFRSQMDRNPPSRWLVELITTRAAYALMLETERGRIAPGYQADLLVIPDSQPDPYSALVEADPSDIALLVCAGVPVYGDPEYRSLFERYSPRFTSVLVSGIQEGRPSAEKLVAGDLLALLDRMSLATGFPIQFPFLPCTKPEKETGRS